MNPDDTIVAVSSAASPAARMIVRSSGPLAVGAARMVAPGLMTGPGSAARAALRFAGLTCPAWAYVFRAPHSYTGEDLVEYHLPGNPVLVELLLNDLRTAGLRPAEAGEFTARAFFNGRLDLTRVEGVAAAIAARSEQELAAARQLMAGELARRLAGPAGLLINTLALLEIGIDFSDEDVTVLPPAELLGRIDGCQKQLRALLAESGRLRRLTHEPTFVLVGRPNAGKSTLLNALAGYDRAVASPVAGTTRDALAAHVSLARGFARVIDVAGLEPESTGAGGADHGGGRRCGGSAVPADSVVLQMREQAERMAAEADFILLVTATDGPGDPPAAGRRPDLLVTTKADLTAADPRPSSAAIGGSSRPAVRVSAVTGDGLADLRAAMADLAFGRAGSESRLTLNARHVTAIQAAVAALDQARLLTVGRGGPPELVSAELREAADAVGAVLGHISPDDLLGRIFSQFCIGK